MMFPVMARLKLTLSSSCLGSESGRVSTSGEVSKSVSFPVIMYEEHGNAFPNGATQSVVGSESSVQMWS